MGESAISGPAPEIYGEGFAAAFVTSRYSLFSRRLAKLALSLVEQHGAPGRVLLDLACGAGEGTVVLAKAGFDTIAIDGSPVMIRYAAQCAEQHGLAISVHRQDMRELSLDRQVDVVTCLFDSLNYLLDVDDLATVLGNVARVLRPGGLFIFDVNTPFGLATRWGTRDLVHTARDDVFEVNQNRYSADTGINNTTTTVFVRIDETGTYRRYTEVHRERGYSAETIAPLIRRAGLEVVSIQGLADSFEGIAKGLSPLDEQTGRIMAVARKAS